jgi:hypothetical protein
MLKLRHEADDRPDDFQVYSGQVRVGRSIRPAATLPAINGFGGSMASRTALARSRASSEHSRMPRPNLPPPGALGSRLPGCTKTRPQRSSKTGIPRRPDLYNLGGTVWCGRLGREPRGGAGSTGAGVAEREVIKRRDHGRMRPIIALIVPQPLAVLAATMGGLAAERRTATSRPALPAIDRYYCTGGRTWATGEVLRALLY